MAQTPRKPTKAHLSRAAKDMHSPNKKVREEAAEVYRMLLDIVGNQSGL